MSSETVTFSEFTNALSNPVVLGIVSFQPLPGNVIIELSTNLAFAIIDRMLGGQGVPLEKNREFSEIEMIIIEKILVIAMQHMREPWKNVVEINPMLERIETNSQFAQVISPTEMTALVTLNIKIGDVEGLINVCLPYLTLESVMDRLNTKYWYANMQERDEQVYTDRMEALVSRAPIPVKAILGNSSISVNDFLGLQLGDIIRLGTKVDEELSVYVGSIQKFTALPGASGENYAVRITSVIKEEQ